MIHRLSRLKGRSTWEHLGEEFLQALVAATERLDEDTFEQFIFLCERFGPLDEDFPLVILEEDFSWTLARTLHFRGKKLMSKNLVQQDQDFAVAGTLCYYYAALLNERYFPAQVAIGSCLARGGNIHGALEYLNQGLSYYRQFKADDNLMNKDVREAVEGFKEETVLALQSELKAKIEEEEKQ